MKYLLHISIVIILSACVKEVEVDIPQHEPSLVVDGVIRTDEVPFVILSKSSDIYAPTDLNSMLETYQNGATITVSDGINSIELDEVCANDLPPGAEQAFAEFFDLDASQLPSLELCIYTDISGNFIGEIGKTYSISIEFENEIYEATSKILEPLPLDSLFWKEEEDSENFGFSWFTISDPPGQFDAYFWETKRINKNDEGEPLDQSFKPAFAPAFDDTFFDGLTFDFAFENPHNFDDSDLPVQQRGLYERGDTVVVRFSKIDEAVFDFMEKKYTQLQSGGSPFAAPINLPSNFNNGAKGVWAAFSPVYDTLICE